MTQKKEILIIEDDIDVIESLSDILIDSDYAVSSCTDGKEAIKLISAKPKKFDLILSDIMMPNMNGISFLEYLCDNEQLAQTPLVFLTAKKETSVIKKAFKLGAYDYIEKPFTAESIINVVTSIVNDNDFISPSAKYQTEYFSLAKTIKNLQEINSHSIQHSAAKIISVINLVESGLLDKKQSWEIIKGMGPKLNKDSSLIQKVIDDSETNIKIPVVSSTKQIKEIFLIDDDATVNKMHEVLLSKHFNYKVSTYLKPKIALKDLTYSLQKPDLIFLDLNMPELDGFEFLNELESNNIDIDVIVLSSSRNSNDIARSLKARNVISYLTKPLTANKIEKLNLHKPETLN